jgi:hypothetical protein
MSHQSLMATMLRRGLARDPWLALVAAAAVATWVASRVALAGWRHRHNTEHAQPRSCSGCRKGHGLGRALRCR